MNRISLEGMEFYARHGYYEEERIIGNKYSVDVRMDTDFSQAIHEDKLEGTVDYEKVYETVREVMNIDTNLLEHLAGKMIKALKQTFPKVNSVTIKISKHNPPIKGLCQRAVVELTG